MSSALELALIVTLAVLLAVASAIAGALWTRVRSIPALRAILLARDLVERLRVLEQLIERFEQAATEQQARATAAARGAAPAHERFRGPEPGPFLRLDLPAEAPIPDRDPPASAATTPTSAPPGRDRIPAPAVPPGPRLIAVPDLSAPAAEPSATETELAARFGPIWSLADEGRAPEAIARESALPIGQVELILGLRRRLVTGERAG
jgi:hypothetical protein